MSEVIALIDISCIKYQLYYSGVKNYIPSVHEGDPKVKNYWVSRLNIIIEDIKSAILVHANADTIKIVFALDGKKPYWRSMTYDDPQPLAVCNAKEKLYKGGRVKTFTPFMDLVCEVIGFYKVTRFKADHAEADDIAGLFCKYKTPEQSIYLVSIDKDWKTLCSDGVFWVNLYTTKYLQISDSLGALNDFQIEYSGVRSLQDVSKAKSIKGERSDNLAAGFDPRLADLINFSCPKSEDFGDFKWDFNQLKEEVHDFLNRS